MFKIILSYIARLGSAWATRHHFLNQSLIGSKCPTNRWESTLSNQKYAFKVSCDSITCHQSSYKFSDQNFRLWNNSKISHTLLMGRQRIQLPLELRRNIFDLKVQNLKCSKSWNFWADQHDSRSGENSTPVFMWKVTAEVHTNPVLKRQKWEEQVFTVGGLRRTR